MNRNARAAAAVDLSQRKFAHQCAMRVLPAIITKHSAVVEDVLLRPANPFTSSPAETHSFLFRVPAETPHRQAAE